MPKKLFKYTLVEGCKDIWHTPSLKGWYIVKNKSSFDIQKGNIINKVLTLNNKVYKSYLRLGDAKVGLENYCKERIYLLKKQEELFCNLKKVVPQKASLNTVDNVIDYDEIERQVLRLKEKWGIKN